MERKIHTIKHIMLIVDIFTLLQQLTQKSTPKKCNRTTDREQKAHTFLENTIEYTYIKKAVNKNKKKQHCKSCKGNGSSVCGSYLTHSENFWLLPHFDRLRNLNEKSICILPDSDFLWFSIHTNMCDFVCLCFFYVGTFHAFFFYFHFQWNFFFHFYGKIPFFFLLFGLFWF